MKLHEKPKNTLEQRWILQIKIIMTTTQSQETYTSQTLLCNYVTNNNWIPMANLVCFYSWCITLTQNGNFNEFKDVRMARLWPVRLGTKTVKVFSLRQ